MMNIRAVGDICPGDVSITGLGILNITNEYGAQYPFNHIRETLLQSDIVIGNLEGLLTNGVIERLKNGQRFCGRPDFAKALFHSGFRIVNLANNHTMEYGPKIFRETVDILKSTGIEACGLRDVSGKYYSEPVMKIIKGIKIGCLGYNWVGVDKFPEADACIAQSHDSIVNYTWDRKIKPNCDPRTVNNHVRQDLIKLKREVDLVILLAHWGYEFVTYPPYNVTIEAKALVDAGADIIIGSHPHVLQGSEIYNNSLICYSLGNFIFDYKRILLRSTAILDVMINGYNNIDYNYIPCFINEDYQPMLAVDKRLQYIRSLIDTSNMYITSSQRRYILDDDQLYKQYERYYNLSKAITIYDHFIALKHDPKIIYVIIRKINRFIQIVLDRIKGKRIRW